MTKCNTCTILFTPLKYPSTLLDDLKNIPSEVFKLNILSKLYSIVYDKWFNIQHLPMIFRFLENGETLEDISKYINNSNDMYMKFYIATELYNKDIGINENLPVNIIDIGKTFLTEAQYKTMKRNKIITYLA